MSANRGTIDEAPAAAPGPSGTAPPFVAACRSLPAPHVPVWLMRQAGRYLPEYRALRARHDFLTLLRTPELAAEATLQPLRRFPLDAAILFADILTPVDGTGVGLDFAPGPVLANPLRTTAAIAAFDPAGVGERAGHVAATIAIVKRELPPGVPLLGFAGAPFTLFAYLVEGHGGAGHGFEAALALLEREPEAAASLLDRLADLTIDYLALQAGAGAQALMLFDSRAGLLDAARYAAIALPPARRVLEALQRFDLPRLYFPRTRSGEPSDYLAAAAALPVEVVGIDERASLARARRILGPRIAVQGNLAPAALQGDDDALDRSVDRVLEDAGPAPGFVFNLGDGVPPTTDPEKIARLVDRVHRRSRAAAAR